MFPSTGNQPHTRDSLPYGPSLMCTQGETVSPCDTALRLTCDSGSPCIVLGWVFLMREERCTHMQSATERRDSTWRSDLA